jgi:hypothetical protein
MKKTGMTIVVIIAVAGLLFTALAPIFYVLAPQPGVTDSVSGSAGPGELEEIDLETPPPTDIDTEFVE